MNANALIQLVHYIHVKQFIASVKYNECKHKEVEQLTEALTPS